MISQVMHRWELPRFGRQSLRLVEVPVPAPDAHEVLVCVSAVSLNYRDKLIIQNGMGMASTLPVGAMLKKRATIQGIGVGPRRVLEDVVRAIDSTGIKPVIAAQHPFSDLQAALDDLDRGPFGKIVLHGTEHLENNK